MTEGNEKLRYDCLHVRVIFYEQDMRHELTSSMNGLR